MNYTKKELRQSVKARVATMEKLLAQSRNRKLSAEETAEFDQAEAEVRALETKLSQLGTIETTGNGKVKGKTEEDRAFTRFMHTGDDRGLQLVMENRADGTGMSTAPNDYGVSAGAPGPGGGYLIPQGFWDNLQVALKAYGGTSNDYRVVQTDTGNPMPWPSVDPTPVVAGVLSGELNPLSVVDPYVFGQGLMNAWTLYVGPVLASIQLVNDSAFDVDQFISDRFGEALGREIASLAISGTGSGQPLGIITALNAKGAVTTSGGYYGLGTATSVNTLAGATTELTGNLLAPQTLLNMIKSVDPAYRALGAAFYVNDAQLARMRTVVDSYGRPLLQNPSQDSGSPTLWGYPVKVDNNIPNLTASTTGGPVFGNMGNAMVMRKVRQASVMRLVERYADYLAVGYLGYFRMDIRSNDLRAAVTVKPAAT